MVSDLNQLQAWELDLLKWESSGDDAVPVYSDISGTVLPSGIRLLALMKRHSHADTYAADHTKIRGHWFEVKVFPTDMESHKQNQYRKRTIQRNRDRVSYQRSERSELRLFLIFSLEFNPPQLNWSTMQLEKLSLLQNLLKKVDVRSDTLEARMQTSSAQEQANVNRPYSSTSETGKLKSWISFSPHWKLPLLGMFPSAALSFAAFYGFAELVESFPKNKNSVHSPGSLEMALVNAADGGHLDIVNILVHALAHSHEGTWYHRALQAAARGGHREIFRILLDLGRKTSPTIQISLLLIAAKEGHKEIAKMLVDAAVKTGAFTIAGRTALHTAVELAHSDIVKLLLDAGADANCVRPTIAGRTALHTAVKLGHAEIVEILLDAGADISAYSKHFDSESRANARAGRDGRTALQVAAEEGHLDIVLLLLSKNADVNIPPAQNDGRTALQTAAGRGHLDIVQLLLSENADVNAPPGEYFGRTALQAAAEGGQVEVVRMLLNAGADPLASPGSYGGMSALAAAMMFGHTQIVRLLLDNGADPLRPGFIHESTISGLARNSKNSEIVHLLEDHITRQRSEGNF